MYFKSKKTSLIILAITTAICSRLWFYFLDDPEGPNLLIVSVLALILYGLSLLVYRLNLPFAGFKRLALAITVQVITVVILFFFLG